MLKYTFYARFWMWTFCRLKLRLLNKLHTYSHLVYAHRCVHKLTLLLSLPLPGSYTQSYVKVLWMWPFPQSSPWTAAVTPHPFPLHLIPPLHPLRSPPTPAPLPNWEGLFMWALSLGCKRTHKCSPFPSSRSVLPHLRRSTWQQAEPLIILVLCLSHLEGLCVFLWKSVNYRNDSWCPWLCILWMWVCWWSD